VAIIPDDQEDNVWEAARTPYAGLQIFRSGDKDIGSAFAA